MRCAVVAMLVVVTLVGGEAQASEVPRRGGELVFVVPGEPPSYDAHREETFALIHPAMPHYSTLLRVDPSDPTGTRIIGDLAESWSRSTDGRTYTVRLRKGLTGSRSRTRIGAFLCLMSRSRSGSSTNGDRSVLT